MKKERLMFLLVAFVALLCTIWAIVLKDMGMVVLLLLTSLFSIVFAFLINKPTT